MKYLSLLVLLAPFTFAACMDDDDADQPNNVTTTINFRSAYDGNDLAIQSETYDYPTGAKLKATLFQYYISDLEITASDGNVVHLSDIELIRYNSAAEDALESRSYEVPAGDYVSIRFGLGVKPDLNAMDPSAFAANDPLNENEFWNANTRYVFAKIEANADLENDGTFDTGLSYHMGSDDLYRELTFVQSFTIDGEGSRELTIVADVLKALSDGTETFDIADPTKQRVHGGNQAIATDIWNRLVAQFTLEVI